MPTTADHELVKDAARGPYDRTRRRVEIPEVSYSLEVEFAKDLGIRYNVYCKYCEWSAGDYEFSGEAEQQYKEVHEDVCWGKP